MQKFLGCSGFYYKDWKGLFYPEDLPVKKWLPYYAEHFNSVEINSSFYHLPKASTLESWYESTPDRFNFTLKGSRYITHRLKLTRSEEPLSYFFKLASLLRDKLGCILWQLPGNQHRNDEKLENFCKLLSGEFNHVFEFRHISWFDEEIYRILKKYKVGFCIVSAPGELPETIVKTSPVAYLRFHGKDEWYNYDYSDRELKLWAEKIKELNPKYFYAYFNNDWYANAVKNCKTLAELMK